MCILNAVLTQTDCKSEIAGKNSWVHCVRISHTMYPVSIKFRWNDCLITIEINVSKLEVAGLDVLCGIGRTMHSIDN